MSVTILAANALPYHPQDFKPTHIESASHIEDISLPRLPTPDVKISIDTTSNLLTLRAQNQLSSRLLRLPRELRDLIITFHIADHSDPHSSTSHCLPPLIQTCHALRPEVAELYYSHKLILAGGAPSPHYEKRFFEGFDPLHKRFIGRVHWLWDAYGTRVDAMRRAGELDRLTGLREGVWTVGFIDVWGRNGEARKGRARYVNAVGSVKEPGSCS